MKKIIEFVKMFLGFVKETTAGIKEISNEVLEVVETSNKIEEKVTETTKEVETKEVETQEVEPITEEVVPAPKKNKKRYYPKKKNK
jgi:methyl-accepting chemotaxis protein